MTGRYPGLEPDKVVSHRARRKGVSDDEEQVSNDEEHSGIV